MHSTMLTYVVLVQSGSLEASFQELLVLLPAAC